MVHPFKTSVCQKSEKFVVMVIFFFFNSLQYLSPRLSFSVRVCGRQHQLPCSYLTKDIVRWGCMKEEEAKHRGGQTQQTNKQQTWSVTWLIKWSGRKLFWQDHLTEDLDQNGWLGSRGRHWKKPHWDIDLPDLSGNKRNNEKKSISSVIIINWLSINCRNHFKGNKLEFCSW